jgi:hypothetical protein
MAFPIDCDSTAAAAHRAQADALKIRSAGQAKDCRDHRCSHHIEISAADQ